MLAALLWSLAALAEDSARDIAHRAREKGALNLVGLTAQLKLVSTGADGRVREQVLTTASKTIDGTSHALARFSQPAGVAGVAVLTIEGKDGAGDEVSLYLPKLKRVRKVARGDRGKSFMDTDFAYADITTSGVVDDGLQRLADAKIEGRDCFVIEGKGDDASPYGTVRLFVDKETSVPMQVEYADKAGKPFKRYHTLKLKAFKGRTLAAESVMENLQANTKTQMTVLSLDETTPGDDAFTERALERG
jgi:hypothetical protein